MHLTESSMQDPAHKQSPCQSPCQSVGQSVSEPVGQFTGQRASHRSFPSLLPHLPLHSPTSPSPTELHRPVMIQCLLHLLMLVGAAGPLPFSRTSRHGAHWSKGFLHSSSSLNQFVLPYFYLYDYTYIGKTRVLQLTEFVVHALILYK